MFKKLLNKFSKNSEQEIIQFKDQFITGPDYDNSIFVWRSAFLNYQLMSNDITFTWSKIINSKLNENLGDISSYIIQTNQLINKFHKNNNIDDLVGAKIWNITLRCMSNPSFAYHGVELWEHIKNLQTIAFDRADEDIDQHGLEAMTAARKLIVFVPPQFSDLRDLHNR